MTPRKALDGAANEAAGVLTLRLRSNKDELDDEGGDTDCSRCFKR
jgi:hypothetical protein